MEDFLSQVAALIVEHWDHPVLVTIYKTAIEKAYGHLTKKKEESNAKKTQDPSKKEKQD